MKKNEKKLIKTCGLGLVGALTLGAAGAFAVDFNGSVTVQNTIAVENLADLSFGTISITAAAGNATPATAEYAAIEVQPDGTTTVGSSATGTIDIVNLGGAAPAQARVVTGSDFTLQFPDGSWVEESDDIGDLATDKDDAIPLISDGIRLQNVQSNPGIADFYLINLTVGQVAQPAGFGVPTAAQGTDLDTWDFTAGTDTQEFTFSIGGTLATDPDVATAYEELLYEGTFQVTATF